MVNDYFRPNQENRNKKTQYLKHLAKKSGLKCMLVFETCRGETGEWTEPTTCIN
jgi:hypothetical protein